MGIIRNKTKKFHSQSNNTTTNFIEKSLSTILIDLQNIIEENTNSTQSRIKLYDLCPATYTFQQIFF